MRPFLITLLLIAFEFAQAEQTNKLTRTGDDVVMRVMKAEPAIAAKRLVLADKFGTQPVLVMEPLQSPSVRSLLPSVTVYRLISGQGSAIVHGLHYSALLLETNGTPSYLPDDEAVALFVGGLGAQVRSREDALRLVRAFADLRSYRIVEVAPDFPDARPLEKQPKPEDTDYRFVAEERRDAWRVYATLFTSDDSGSCERYVFSIWKSPGSGMSLAAPVTIRLRSIVY